MGGCAAHSLWQLGAFVSAAEGVELLDRAGAIELHKRRLHSRRYPAAKVYVHGDYWHPVVIAAAILDRGFDFEKMKLEEVVLSESG